MTTYIWCAHWSLGLPGEAEGTSYPDTCLIATAKQLDISHADATDYMQAAFTGGWSMDGEMRAMLSSEAATDALGREDAQVVDKLIDASAVRNAARERMRRAIQTARAGGQPGRISRPRTYIGDRSMTQSEVREMAPDPFYAVTVVRDDMFKCWRILYGPRFEDGWRWSVSRSWGPSGNEKVAVNKCLVEV
jgi:hypothetical protein